MFPPSARTKFVRSLTKADLENLPAADQIPKDNVYALFRYANATTRNIVQAAKYDSCRYGAQIMGHLLHDHLLTICAKNRIITDTIMLVPIPLSKKRKRQRGFNQCRRIIKYICQQDNENNFQLMKALEKPEATQPQASLSQSQRRENLRGSFTLADDLSVTNKNVIIIDDVTTTGATFAEACSTLKKDNPENVYAVAFSH